MQAVHAQSNNVNGMTSPLKSLGVHNTLADACEIMTAHGFSPVVTYDPYTKEVDVYGAILLAFGASENLLAQGNTEPEESGVPLYRCALVRATVDYFESMVGDEISAWCISQSQQDATNALKQASDRIAISIG